MTRSARPAGSWSLPPSLVDRGEGWIIRKIGKIDQASHVAVGAEYHLIFEGHEALVFDQLGTARARSKEGPPEKAPVAEAAAEPEVAEESEVAETAEDTEVAAEPAEDA